MPAELPNLMICANFDIDQLRDVNYAEFQNSHCTQTSADSQSYNWHALIVHSCCQDFFKFNAKKPSQLEVYSTTLTCTCM
jgi:hypothetical protein